MIYLKSLHAAIDPTNIKGFHIAYTYPQKRLFGLHMISGTITVTITYKQGTYDTTSLTNFSTLEDFSESLKNVENDLIELLKFSDSSIVKGKLLKLVDAMNAHVISQMQNYHE